MTDSCGRPLPCCPCDLVVHPPKPDIAAGLDALPRQVVGFPEYRRAMLQQIHAVGVQQRPDEPVPLPTPLYPALADWRAREGDDLGILLLEMWAYVLDVLGFYDERIANESYLRTADLRPSLRRLVELVGYLPRPALSSSVVLAAFADGPDSLVVPAGTALRSQAFNGEAPQIFESSNDALVAPERNEWTVADLRADTYGDVSEDGMEVMEGRLLLEPTTSALTPGQIALFQFPGGGLGHAARVTDVRSIEALDGQVYVAPTLDPEPPLAPTTPLNSVDILTPSLTARRHPLLAQSVSRDRGPTANSPGELEMLDTTLGATKDLDSPPPPDLILDALYSQLQNGSIVVVERQGELEACEVCVRAHEVPIGESPGPPVQIPVTGVDFCSELPGGWRSDPGSLTLHFQMVAAGRLTRPAKPLVDDELRNARLEGSVEPFDSPPPSELFLHDAKNRGVRVTGGVAISGAGEGTVSVNKDQLPTRLRTPVRVYGNLVPATRGESAFNEVMGSGDGSVGFQSFILGKAPLTYLNDAAAPQGRRSSLTVRVNGLLWREVPSFFGTRPEDEVYIVRQNDDDESTVTFGNGEFGARLPTGLDNVVANYRYGGGAASPPANLITELSRPVAGLRGVVNPVAAGGGADADQPEDIRRNASTSALTLGRAVSLLDFQAFAFEFGGVVNAQVDWAWDDGRQRALVKVWFIGDGGAIGSSLKAFLLGQAEPHTPLDVEEATPIPSGLVIDLETGPRYTPADVEQAVLAALTDPVEGLLAPENIPIGCPLFRSRIYEQVMTVDGVATVRSASLDGLVPVPPFITTPEGHYRDFGAGLTVGASSLVSAGGTAP